MRGLRPASMHNREDRLAQPPDYLGFQVSPQRAAEFSSCVNSTYVELYVNRADNESVGIS